MDWFQQQAAEFFAFSLFIMVCCLPAIIGLIWLVNKVGNEPTTVDHECDPEGAKLALWVLGAYMVFITLKGTL